MAGIDVHSLGAFIREQREAAEVSLRQLARSAGVSNPYLSQVERGLKKPSAEILGQIASALRISAETLYVRAGLLEPRDGDTAVTDAIGADRTLSERQRQVLLEIYAAFQTENAAAAATGGAADAPADPDPDSAPSATGGTRPTTKDRS
ncbi:MAG: helix-turn-helix domain-containing protein [Frankiales bacterium]|nr:helix-turn-helix domain-containing protein [Frankiales bacterium]